MSVILCVFYVMEVSCCDSYLVRTDPRDVARVESKTFMCTETRQESNPVTKEGVKSQLGNWMSVQDMEHELGERLPNCMNGKNKKMFTDRKPNAPCFYLDAFI